MLWIVVSMFYIRSSDYVHPTLNGFTLLSASFYFPHPQSLAVTCPPSVSMSLTFFRFHIKWNLKSLFFFVWLISLSRMPFNYFENRFCIKLSVFFFFFSFGGALLCFFTEVKAKAKVKVTQSYLTLCELMDCARQAPLSMGFSRQEYWSG